MSLSPFLLLPLSSCLCVFPTLSRPPFPRAFVTRPERSNKVFPLFLLPFIPLLLCPFVGVCFSLCPRFFLLSCQPFSCSHNTSCPWLSHAETTCTAADRHTFSLSHSLSQATLTFIHLTAYVVHDRPLLIERRALVVEYRAFLRENVGIFVAPSLPDG